MEETLSNGPKLCAPHLKGKGCLSHPLKKGPDTKNLKYNTWDKEDSMIMSWLWDFMDRTISDTCMTFGTSLAHAYSKAHDVAQVYKIKVEIAATKQGTKSGTEYETLLQNLWQELDHYGVF
ncbi:hypothetical protein CR513_49324, partial [Mucuna pruriens]